MAAPDRFGSRNGADRRERDAASGDGNGTGRVVGAHGRAAGRSGGPVVPNRRAQRIERSPATVVRQAGEVRGRSRNPPRPIERDDSWAHSIERPAPSDPVSTAFELVRPDVAAADDAVTGGVGAIYPTMSMPPPPALTPTSASLGDITYDRLPAVLDLPDTSVHDVVPIVEPLVLPAPPAAGPEREPDAPFVRPQRSLFKRRTRVRKVSRVVRRVDAWSVLKVSVIFYAIANLVLLVAGVLLWNLAQTTGTVANVEGFIRELFSLKTFKIDGQRLYRASWPISVFLVVAGTGLNVTAAVMFNLITDLVGGVRVTVLEEEVRVVDTTRARRRRAKAKAQAAAAGDATADGSKGQAG
jgi:hypothetical protein